MLKKETVVNPVLLINISEELVDAYNLIQEVKASKFLTEVSFLERTATLRVILSISAKILCAWFLAEEKSVDQRLKSTLDKFFATLTKFVLKYKNSEAHIYLLKQVVRNHGIQSLKEIVMKSEMEWLLTEDIDSVSIYLFFYISKNFIS